MQEGLSIIIVNYNTPQLVINCLQSFYPSASNAILEVIVVDNASRNNDRELVLKVFPHVKWIQMDYNAGFARANNEGIRQSSGNAVLLLNSDTLIKDNAIENCYKTFVSSGYVACGVQLLNEDQTPQMTGFYNLTGGLNNLLRIPYIKSFVKKLGELVKVKKINVTEITTTTEVDWINGAFLMVKRSAIDKAGLMDEDFFLYSEESEWCGRLQKVGKLCIYGQFNVIHLLGETAKQTFGFQRKDYDILYDRKGLQILLSNFVRIRKEFGLGWYFFQMLLYTLAIPVVFICSFIENLFKLKNPFEDFPMCARLFTHVMELWYYSPRIVSGRPYFYKVL